MYKPFEYSRTSVPKRQWFELPINDNTERYTFPETDRVGLRYRHYGSLYDVYVFHLPGTIQRWLTDNNVDYSLEVFSYFDSKGSPSTWIVKDEIQVLEPHDSVQAYIIVIPNPTHAMLYKLTFAGEDSL